MRTRTTYEKGRFRETCGPCGASFEVVVLAGPFIKGWQDEFENYQCPECGHAYRCRGTEPPSVRLLSPRTDGL
jgi:hypothetical protein